MTDLEILRMVDACINDVTNKYKGGYNYSIRFRQGYLFACYEIKYKIFAKMDSEVDDMINEVEEKYKWQNNIGAQKE